MSWNVRGLNGEDAIRQAKLLTKYHKPDLIFLMETKLASGSIKRLCDTLSFDYGFEIPRNGLGRGSNDFMERLGGCDSPYIVCESFQLFAKVG